MNTLKRKILIAIFVLNAFGSGVVLSGCGQGEVDNTQKESLTASRELAAGKAALTEGEIERAHYEKQQEASLLLLTDD